ERDVEVIADVLRQLDGWFGPACVARHRERADVAVADAYGDVHGVRGGGAHDEAAFCTRRVEARRLALALWGDSPRVEEVVFAVGWVAKDVPPDEAHSGTWKNVGVCPLAHEIGDVELVDDALPAAERARRACAVERCRPVRAVKNLLRIAADHVAYDG